jgi:hypothetical protein
VHGHVDAGAPIMMTLITFAMSALLVTVALATALVRKAQVQGSSFSEEKEAKRLLLVPRPR